VGVPVGGVAVDATYVYCAARDTLHLHRLNKTTGEKIDALELTGGSDSGSLYGGLAVVAGRLYRGVGR